MSVHIGEQATKVTAGFTVTVELADALTKTY